MTMLDVNIERSHNEIVKIINASISHIYPKCNVVLLYGSLGRNEGAFLIAEDSVLPYNDVDILIVSDRLLLCEIDEEIFKLKNLLACQFLDVSVVSTAEYLRKRKSIFYYDLVHHSRILWKSPSFLRVIPDVSTIELGWNDIEKLFFTRLYSALVVIDANVDEINDSDKIFRFYQLTKLFFAVIDMLSIKKNAYSGLYKEKLLLAKEFGLYSESIDVGLFLKVKHRPSEALSLWNLYDLYRYEVLKGFRNVFFDLFKTRYFFMYKHNNFFENPFFKLKMGVLSVKYFLKEGSFKKYRNYIKEFKTRYFLFEHFTVENDALHREYYVNSLEAMYGKGVNVLKLKQDILIKK